ncbi:MAG: PA2779 family protein [Chromatiales bacterium]
MLMLNKFFAVMLSLSLIMLPMGAAQSAMIGNSQLLDGDSAAARTALMQALERDQVRSQLIQLGVDAEAVKARISQMTEQEIANLNQHLGDLPAGGDVLGVILVIFVVFIITDAIGATDIFPFVHPVR